MYSGIDPSIKEYIAQFCEEAEYRWADEKANDCLLNLASTCCLYCAVVLGENVFFVELNCSLLR